MNEPLIVAAGHRLRERSVMWHTAEHPRAPWGLCAYEPCPIDRQTVETLLGVAWGTIYDSALRFEQDRAAARLLEGV